eukprot:gnl/TRDRNA2_/TRDRNA2_176783_c0_seq1.p2 gnl/TRDRNA2_/TRDRNA2_176783_c0~~gnl/TRDRNA2_/TRDRNA2_176783_c0_seq1.p2  ORF type:complete len:192 (-),score=33.65 gnl/TRDRNA2_/TRDRNA2_176783_c0_seq1:91-666(-)
MQLNAVQAEPVTKMHERMWDHAYQNLKAVCAEQQALPTRQRPSDISETTRAAARFVNNQRTAYAQGKLSQERKNLLLQIPQWSWKPAGWQNSYETVQQVIEKLGALPRQTTKNPEEKAAARFINNQRSLFKQGTLSRERRVLLSKLPHWSWASRPQQRLSVRKRPSSSCKRPAAASAGCKKRPASSAKTRA